MTAIKFIAWTFISWVPGILLEVFTDSSPVIALLGVWAILLAGYPLLFRRNEVATVGTESSINFASYTVLSLIAFLLSFVMLEVLFALVVLS